MEVTHNNLPEAVSKLFARISNIESLLLQKSNNQDSNSPVWFNLTELCNYLPDRPKLATVYGWVHEKTIPYHKGQKKLRFLKSEIDEWLNQGKKKTVIESRNAAFESVVIKTKKTKKRK